MKNEKLILFALACVQFTNIVDFMIIMPLGPQLMRTLEINPKEYSLLVSSYTFAAGIIGFLGALFLDKFDRKRSVIFFYSGFSIGTILCGLAASYELLLTARIFTGLFGGIMTANVLSILTEVIPEERRGQAMGVIMAAFSAASIFGVPFGLYLSNLFNWQAPFYFLTGIELIVLSLLVISLPSLRSHLDSGIKKLSPIQMVLRVMQNRNQQKALLFLSLLMFGQFSIIPYISPYLVSNVGFSEEELTYVYLLGGAFTLISSPLIGKLADRIGKHKVAIIMGSISLIPLFVLTHLSVMPIAYALIITTSFMILITGRMIPSMAIITSTALPENRGSFMSITSSVQQLSAGLCAYIAGLMISETPSGQLEHYDLVGYVAIGASILAFYLVKKIKVVDEKNPQKEAIEIKEIAS